MLVEHAELVTCNLTIRTPRKTKMQYCDRYSVYTEPQRKRYMSYIWVSLEAQIGIRIRLCPYMACYRYYHRHCVWNSVHNCILSGGYNVTIPKYIQIHNIVLSRTYYDLPVLTTIRRCGVFHHYAYS